jgi:hypothetical protein
MIAILAVSMLGLMIALIAVGVGARKMLTDQTHSKPMRTQTQRCLSIASGLLESRLGPRIGLATEDKSNAAAFP